MLDPRMKCSRDSPCDSCVKYGDAATCSYASQANQKNISQRPRQTNNKDALESRIDRLEALLMSAMNGSVQLPNAGIGTRSSAESPDLPNRTTGSSPESPSTDSSMVDDEGEVDDLGKSVGIMKVGEDQVTSEYLGENHWVSIMCEVSIYVYNSNMLF